MKTEKVFRPTSGYIFMILSIALIAISSSNFIFKWFFLGIGAFGILVGLLILSGFLADEFIVGFTQHQPKLVPGRYSLSVNGEQISSMYVYNVQEGIQAENGILIFVYRLSLGAVK